MWPRAEREEEDAGGAAQPGSSHSDVSETCMQGLGESFSTATCKKAWPRLGKERLDGKVAAKRWPMEPEMGLRAADSKAISFVCSLTGVRRQEAREALFLRRW